MDSGERHYFAPTKLNKANPGDIWYMEKDNEDYTTPLYVQVGDKYESPKWIPAGELLTTVLGSQLDQPSMVKSLVEKYFMAKSREAKRLKEQC